MEDFWTLDFWKSLKGGEKMAELVKDVTFTGVLTDVKALVPIVLPTVIGFISFRKGLSFLINTLKRA